MVRYYCDFPNGQQVHVKRITDILPYALRFGWPVRVYTNSMGGNEAFYSVHEGREMKKMKGEHGR